MRSVLAIAGAGLLLTLPLWTAAAETGDPVAAVWKEQRITFTYMGRTSRYSCEGLRDKVSAMLMDLGARRDMKISPIGCFEDRPSTRTGWLGPKLALVFATPALPDP